MISKINFNSPFLESREQIETDYGALKQPRYIEVATGHVCAPAYRRGLYCLHTGRIRHKLLPQQYLRVLWDDFAEIAGGNYTGRLDYFKYAALIPGKNLDLSIPD